MTTQSKPIREIIGENISFSRFAKCMGISRPTLYKYMDAYNSKNIDLIPDSILKVFDTASTQIPTSYTSIMSVRRKGDHARILYLLKSPRLSIQKASM